MPVGCFLLFSGVSALIMFIDDAYEARIRESPNVDYFSEFTSGKIPMTNDNGENTEEFDAAFDRYLAAREEFVDSLPLRLKLEMHIWAFWLTLFPDVLDPYLMP